MLYCYFHFNVALRFIYSKYSDILTPYHTYSEVGTSSFYYLLMCFKTVGRVANIVNRDQTPRSADVGLHCLLRPDGPKTFKNVNTVAVTRPVAFG